MLIVLHMIYRTLRMATRELLTSDLAKLLNKTNETCCPAVPQKFNAFT